MTIDIRPESLYNRSMDTHAVDQPDADAAPSKWRLCALCHERFYPKRKTQLYCNEFCRKGRNPEAVVRYCAWCEKQLSSTNPKAKYCTDSCRLAAFNAKDCFYCGAPADTRDHFIPKAFYYTIQNLKWDQKQILVPCCKECNSTAGDRVFKSFREKRLYIKERYLKKYAKYLDTPNWSQKELEELGSGLKSYIIAGQRIKFELRKRIARLGGGKHKAFTSSTNGRVLKEPDEIDIIVDKMMKEELAKNR